MSAGRRSIGTTPVARCKRSVTRATAARTNRASPSGVSLIHSVWKPALSTAGAISATASGPSEPASPSETTPRVTTRPGGGEGESDLADGSGEGRQIDVVGGEQDHIVDTGGLEPRDSVGDLGHGARQHAVGGIGAIAHHRGRALAGAGTECREHVRHHVGATLATRVGTPRLHGLDGGGDLGHGVTAVEHHTIGHLARESERLGPLRGGVDERSSRRRPVERDTAKLHVPPLGADRLAREQRSKRRQVLTHERERGCGLGPDLSHPVLHSVTEPGEQTTGEHPLDRRHLHRRGGDVAQRATARCRRRCADGR